MGIYLIRTVAHTEGECHIDFLIFPIVKYTGHAILSPLKFDRCILSDARITSAIVALVRPVFWNLSYYQGDFQQSMSRQATADPHV